MDQYNRRLKKLPQRTTFQNELTRLGKRMFGPRRYVGTFAADRIPVLRPNQSCILNVDRSDQPGSHWIALARGKTTKQYAYDSFGRKAKTLVPGLPLGVIDSELDAEQHTREVNCGARCLAWLDVFYKQGPAVALTI